MPLAVDSIQVQRAAAGVASSVSSSASSVLLYFALALFAAGQVAV